MQLQEELKSNLTWPRLNESVLRRRAKQLKKYKREAELCRLIIDARESEDDASLPSLIKTYEDQFLQYDSSSIRADFDWQDYSRERIHWIDAFGTRCEVIRRFIEDPDFAEQWRLDLISQIPEIVPPPPRFDRPYKRLAKQALSVHLVNQTNSDPFIIHVLLQPGSDFQGDSFGFYWELFSETPVARGPQRTDTTLGVPSELYDRAIQAVLLRLRELEKPHGEPACSGRWVADCERQQDRFRSDVPIRWLIEVSLPGETHLSTISGSPHRPMETVGHWTRWRALYDPAQDSIENLREDIAMT